MNKFCWRKDGVGGSLEVLSESPEFIAVREPNSQITFEIERARFERDYTYDPAPPAGPVGQIKRRQHGEIIGGLVLVLAILAPMSSLAGNSEDKFFTTEYYMDACLKNRGDNPNLSYWGGASCTQERMELEVSRARKSHDEVVKAHARYEAIHAELEAREALEAAWRVQRIESLNAQSERLKAEANKTQRAEQAARDQKHRDARDEAQRIQVAAKERIALEAERTARLASYLDHCPITDNVRDYVRSAPDSAPLPNECK
jgi:hypothetical protein